MCPRKAAAAVEWCKTASKGGTKWQYVFTPQRRDAGTDRQSVCRSRDGPAFRLCKAFSARRRGLRNYRCFGTRTESDAEAFFSSETFEKLPTRAKKAAADALDLYRFFERKEGTPNFAPAFGALLGPFDDASKAVIVKLLQDKVPPGRADQQSWFEPYMGNVDQKARTHYEKMAKNLKRGLLYGNPHSVIGLLRSCFDFALNDKSGLDGVFDAVRDGFRFPGARKLLERITSVNDFRNTFIAHPEMELTDKALAEKHLKNWVEALGLLRI